ncbi:MAG: prepilin-type N-terminal cleavage/methylation domain-containing protein [Candidatus Saccharimonadales bacterium]
MLGNSKHRTQRQSGFTLPEVIITLLIIAILSAALMTIYFLFFNQTIRNSYHARLAVESQSILRLIVEELRVSSGVHAVSKPDSYVVGGGANWSTSNSNLVLIIATPAVDINNNVLYNTSAGEPYINELVYYATNGTLYRRQLADSSAVGNKYKTSCPPANISPTCPQDALLTNHFKSLSFKFFDQDNTLIPESSGDITQARSIELTIDMEHKTFGETVNYTNTIRMTMRNNQL